MLKIDKNLISTYLALNNKKTDEYLARVANEFFKDLQRVDDNNQIIELLDILIEFIYKVPNQAIDIIEYVVNHPLDPKIIKSPFGEYESKNYAEVVVKALEILDRIRYIHPNGVLPLLAQLTLNEKKEISNKAQEVLKHFTKYDFNVLTKSKVGYGVQRKVLDFVLAWPRDEQLQHIDFVETALKEILSSSVEGTTSGLNDEAQYTITMHFGIVSPTDFLKKMRRETIDLVYELYKAVKDPKTKLKLIQVFDEVTRTPSNVVPGDDVVKMITDDLKYLTKIYRGIIFPDAGKMIQHLGVVEEIEQRLYWINKSEKRKVEDSEKLRKEILQDNLYQLFRLLVGDPITYREEEGWDMAEKSRDEEINNLVESVTDSGIGGWFKKLESIASQHILIDDWQFRPFKILLQKLAQTKPGLSDKLLNMAFENEAALKNFASGFLDGLRIGMHFELWDKYADKIIAMKEPRSVATLVYSLNIIGEVDLGKYIRDADLGLLENIVKKQEQFSFLNEKDEMILHHALINTLVRSYQRSPQRIEPLIVEELKSNPKHLNMYFQQLPMMLWKRWIDFQNLQSETVELFKNLIVELPDIDWHTQELILAIGQRDGVRAVLDIFMKRIQKDAERKEKEGRRIDKMARYEVIPYHFNPDLSKFTVEHPEYPKIMGKWVEKMTGGWTLYNWNVSHFLQRLKVGFEDIILSLIKKGGDKNLAKAARAMESIDVANLELIMEVVRRTDNKKILSQVETRTYTTGVVSGEYGIANAYEGRAKELERYLKDQNPRIRAFAEKMTKEFMERSKEARQRADEEKQLRKIEFER